MNGPSIDNNKFGVRDFKDNGCRFEPSCIDCPRPLEECPSWTPIPRAAPINKRTDYSAIVADLRSGLRIVDIARKYHLKYAAVYGIKKRELDAV